MTCTQHSAHHLTSQRSVTGCDSPRQGTHRKSGCWGSFCGPRTPGRGPLCSAFPSSSLHLESSGKRNRGEVYKRHHGHFQYKTLPSPTSPELTPPSLAVPSSFCHQHPSSALRVLHTIVSGTAEASGSGSSESERPLCHLLVF